MEVPHAVHVFLNSMVMVFDKSGQQIPELQGPLHEVKETVLKAAHKGTVFYDSVYMESNKSISRDTFAAMERRMPVVD